MLMAVKLIDSTTPRIAYAVSREVKQLMLFSAATRRIRKPSVEEALLCGSIVLMM